MNSSFFICSLVLLLTTASTTCSAFVVGGVSNSYPKTTTTVLKDTEESEWYSPPVQVDPTPLRQPGVVPVETTVKSPDDLLHFLNDEQNVEDDRVAIVKYHAAWCKSCRRFNLRMDKIIAQQADLIVSKNNKNKNNKLHRRGQVRFASVEFGTNDELCRNQGIETLPTTRFYKHGKLVGEITGGTKSFPRIQDMVSYHVQNQIRHAKKKKQNNNAVVVVAAAAVQQ